MDGHGRGYGPASRTAPPTRRATSRFCGYGSPWLISVDSSATTARRPARASATSALIASRSSIIGAAPR